LHPKRPARASGCEIELRTHAPYKHLLHSFNKRLEVRLLAVRIAA